LSWRRLLLLAVVALGLAPGTWVRSPKPVPDNRQRLEITRVDAPHYRAGPLELVGAWRLWSPNSDFGGYSGLVLVEDGQLLAASDRGRLLQFSAPGGAGPAKVRLGPFPGKNIAAKWLADIEAITRDPSSGKLWVAYEGSNAIERMDRSLASEALARPAAMAGWSVNGGPEAMTRLRDGRFIVLGERSDGMFTKSTPGLLFPSDPAAGAEPIRFSFIPPAKYSPTDIVELPDGKLLVLLRSVALGLPISFPVKLGLAEVSKIRPDGSLKVQIIGDVAAPLPSANFEGLAIDPDGRGGATVWIISDDNSGELEPTLLLKWHWSSQQKARGSTARP
jgi:hypothetical protein